MAASAAGPSLRDMSIGRVFERAIATFRHNLSTTLILSLLFGALPILGIHYLNAELNRTVGPNPGWGMLSVQMIISFVLFGMASSLVQAAFTPAVIAESRGERASASECVLAVVGSALLLAILSVTISILLIFGTALLVVPGLLLWVVWSVAIPVLIGERGRIGTALRRSGELTMGARWSIFGLLLVLFAVSTASSAVVEVVSGEWNNDDIASILSNPTYVALSVLTGMIVNSFSAAVIASLYIELRDWKGGPATETLEQVFA